MHFLQCVLFIFTLITLLASIPSIITLKSETVRKNVRKPWFWMSATAVASVGVILAIIGKIYSKHLSILSVIGYALILAGGIGGILILVSSIGQKSTLFLMFSATLFIFISIFIAVTLTQGKPSKTLVGVFIILVALSCSIYNYLFENVSWIASVLLCVAITVKGYFIYKLISFTYIHGPLISLHIESGIYKWDVKVLSLFMGNCSEIYMKELRRLDNFIQSFTRIIPKLKV